jgi:hypothetical protein
MELKVRALDDVEQKSAQQIEEELLKKHEEQVSASEQVETTNVVDTSQAGDLSEDKVLDFLDKKYGRKLSSVEDLFSSQKEDLPEDVSAFLNFKKETGRGLNDFVKINSDLDSLDPDQILKEYYSQKESDLDTEEIEYLIADKFSYDEDLDDEKDIKKKQIEKKKELAKAKKFLEEQKQKYKAPLESSYGSLSAEEQEALKAYKEYSAKAQSSQELEQRQAEWFLKKTDEVFNNDFKGFDFKVGDKELKFSPGDYNELKKTQSNINNFIAKFVNNDGLIEDAKGYHKSLAVAMNPEKFAKFFYEQGIADAIEKEAKSSKNINFEVRRSPEVINKGGFKVTSVGESDGRGLRIRFKK